MEVTESTCSVASEAIQDGADASDARRLSCPPFSSLPLSTSENGLGAWLILQTFRLRPFLHLSIATLIPHGFGHISVLFV